MLLVLLTVVTFVNGCAEECVLPKQLAPRLGSQNVSQFFTTADSYFAQNNAIFTVVFDGVGQLLIL